MQLVLQNIGKRFGKEWIVRGVNEKFSDNERIAILGPNGSGKSTLLKLIASYVLPTEGKIEYFLNGEEVLSDKIFRHISYAAPYLELIDQMTLNELILHHEKFKPFRPGISPAGVLEILQMERHSDKQVQLFSSGMKMRVRLALAFLSDTDLLLLDEPLSNLDLQGIEWYNKLVGSYLDNRAVVVCSNHMKEEYFFCQRRLEIQATGQLKSI